MTIEKMRGEFEEWARDHLIYGDDPEDVEGFSLRMESRYYISTETQAAWEAWQASRAAVVIELIDALTFTPTVPRRQSCIAVKPSKPKV